MSHISRKRLDHVIRSRIDAQLVRLVTKRWLRPSGTQILSDLLTQTEKLMLSKRLALIAMIRGNCSSYEINKLLGISTATVKKFRDSLERGAFKSLNTVFGTKKFQQRLLDELEIFFRVGPPPKGARWSKTYKKIAAIRNEQKQRKRIPF